MPDRAEARLRWALENAKPEVPRLLFGGTGDFGIVERAASDARRRRTLEAAWERIIPLEWRSAMSIESLSGGVLTVRVSSPPWAERLRRDTGRLARELARFVPGVRQVRAVLGPSSTPGEG